MILFPRRIACFNNRGKIIIWNVDNRKIETNKIFAKGGIFGIEGKICSIDHSKTLFGFFRHHRYDTRCNKERPPVFNILVVDNKEDLFSIHTVALPPYENGYAIPSFQKINNNQL